jgi:hypothetical protein
MSNFLVLLPTSSDIATGMAYYRAALAVAPQLLLRSVEKSLVRDWAHVVTFPRDNGTSTPLVEDTAGETWLLVVGTWFHRHGFHVGDETELLARYLKVGPQQLAEELEGFYCVVIGDARTREVIAITDIVGSCHAFMRMLSGATALSGSSLLLAALGSCAIDAVGCHEFLYTGVIYEDRTFYRDVRKLGPARIYRFTRDAQPTSIVYWDVQQVARRKSDDRATVASLWGALTTATRRIEHAFPRIVCDLTGGYDSRTLAAALLGSGARFETTVSGDATSRDVVVSSGLARVAGLTHRVMSDIPQTLELAKRSLAYTDGEYDLVEYAQILYVHSELMKGFDISLNGSYGEVARGYWWELLAPFVGAPRALDAHRLARARFATDGPAIAPVPNLMRLDLASHFVDVIERVNRGLGDLPNTAQMDSIYLTMRMQRWQGRIASSTNRIWPCLSPFLFRSVLEIMLAASPRLRRRGLLVRRLLAEYQSRFAHYPLEHGYPAVPFSWSTAHRFAPLITYYGRKAWLRGLRRLGLARATPRHPNSPLHDELTQRLDPSNMCLSRLFGRAAVDSYVAALIAGAPAVPASRVYTLEVALEALERAGAPPSA